MNVAKKNDIPKKLFLFVFYFFAMYIISTILAITLYYTLRFIFPNNPNNETLALTLTNLLTYAILVFVLLFILRRYYNIEINTFKKKIFYFIGIAIAGWVFNLFLNIFIEMLMQAFGFVSRETENQQAIEKALKYPLLAVPMIVIGAPIVEETIFRGVIFNFARNLKLPYKLNIILGFILSSSLFGMIHVFSAYLSSRDYTELILGISYVAAGFVLTLLYYMTNNLLVPMTMHFIQNSFSVVIILLLPYLPADIPSKSVFFLSYLIQII